MRCHPRESGDLHRAVAPAFAGVTGEAGVTSEGGGDK